MRILGSDRSKFSGRYSGKAAEQYEDVRHDAKWDREEQLFDEFYARVAPGTVLDCPVGTGRFFDRYVRDNIFALGVDLSDDMLAQAALKIPAGANIQLRKADVLDATRISELGLEHDLIVCVRFVYAVARNDLPTLFRNFAATRSRYLLAGVRVRPDATGKGQRLLRIFWDDHSKRPRLPFGRRSKRYIASEEALHRLFHDTGWQIVERGVVTKEAELGRYFYLLRLGSVDNKADART